MTFRQLDPSSPHTEVHKIIFSNEVRFRLDLIAPKGNENESSERGGEPNLEVWNIKTMMRHWSILEWFYFHRYQSSIHLPVLISFDVIFVTDSEV